jgi:uncharacterized protein (TIGR02466 family)
MFPRTQNIFSTPLLIDRIEDESVVKGLEESILKRRAEDPGIRRSNIGGGWHSDLQLLKWGGDPARKLLGRTFDLVNAATKDMSPRGKDVKSEWIAEAWANVNENGGANARHIHGGCFWSAVLYVRVDAGTGGDLVMYDPRMPMLAMHAPHLRFKIPGGEREIRVKPKPGWLIAFPAWLPHAVDPWEGEGLRISIAINLTAARIAAVRQGTQGGQVRGPGATQLQREPQPQQAPQELERDAV